MRIIRVTKLFKTGKYSILIFRIIDKYLKLKPTVSRILVIVALAIFLVHIFACVFYLIARLEDFDKNTWVNHRDNSDIEGS